MTGLRGICNGFRIVEAQATGGRRLDERLAIADWKLPGPDVPGAPVNDARVARKVAQPLGPAMLCELSGGAADCHALDSDRARHQASAVTDVAAPDREIEAILDQIHRPVAKGKLQF